MCRIKNMIFNLKSSIMYKKIPNFEIIPLL